VRGNVLMGQPAVVPVCAEPGGGVGVCGDIQPVERLEPGRWQQPAAVGTERQRGRGRQLGVDRCVRYRARRCGRVIGTVSVPVEPVEVPLFGASLFGELVQVAGTVVMADQPQLGADAGGELHEGVCTCLRAAVARR